MNGVYKGSMMVKNYRNLKGNFLSCKIIEKEEMSIRIYYAC